MNISEFSVLTGGILTLGMLIFHIKFYVLFGWKSEFGKIQILNHRILYTIHIALILFFLIFSLLSFTYLKELSACSGLAFGVMLFYALFWLWRVIWQIFYFKGKTTLHYFLILIFSLLFITYFIPIILKF